MNKKPFDLQKAIAGAKIVSRDGREVEQFFYFDKATQAKFPIGVVFKGDGVLYGYNVKGEGVSEQLGEININNEYDLLLAPETVTIEV